MRVILKILAAPFVVVLTIMVAVLSFLFAYATLALKIVSVLFVVIGVTYLFTNTLANGCIMLFLAFLISPFGLPAIADWLLDKLDDLNYSLKCFITS